MKPAMLLLLLICTLSVQAESLYRWVDAQGVVHYSEVPPADMQAQRINVATPAKIGTVSPKQEEPVEQGGVNNADNATEPQETPEQKAARQRNCEVVKGNLKTMEEHALIKEADPATGEFRVISETERQTKMQQAKDRIKEWCY